MSDAPRQTGPDFLGRLIDNALGRSETVVPRMPSAFEPLPPSVSPSAPPWERRMAPPDTPGEEIQEGGVRAEAEPIRPASVTLVSSPHPSISTGEAQAPVEPVQPVLGVNPQVEITLPPRGDVTEEARSSSQRVAAGDEPGTRRFDRSGANSRRETSQGETVRRASPALVSAPHVFTSVGEGRAVARPVHRVAGSEIIAAAEPREEVFSAVLRADLPDFADRETSVAPVKRVSSPFAASIKMAQDYAPRRQAEEPAVGFIDPSPHSPAHPDIAGSLIPKAPPVVASFAAMSRSEDRRAPSSIREVETEPVINVTIGRIEVRAVADHSNVSRPSHESRERKPMSLDEYLKRRGEGR